MKHHILIFMAGGLTWIVVAYLVRSIRNWESHKTFLKSIRNAE